MTIHIPRLRNRLQQLFSMFLISLLVASSSPALAFAEEVPPPDATTTVQSTEPVPAPESVAPATETTPTTTETTTPPATTTVEDTTAPSQGPSAPTGADASTYTFNETTGLWENDVYTWNPATNQTAPKEQQTFSYNPETGKWDTTEWIYDAPTGSYVPNVISVSTPPEGAMLTDEPASSDVTEGTSEKATPSMLSTSLPTATSTNTAADTPDSNGFFDLFTDVTISNTISSLAETGDAVVALNTLAGSALSGSATAIATVINLLQSSWNLLADSFTTFTQNLFGNMLGDLVLSPGSTSAASSSAPQNLTINAEQNAAIDNTITLEANSGDATVSQNTQAGDATSGDATAIANLINAINTSIAAGTSFVGMLNIFGNLDGDILIPDELKETLLAANTLGSLDTSNIENSSLLAEFTNNQTIANNVNLDATSGDATVANNTAAGSATTGDAETNLTVLNLTGKQIIGKDALLVFVNVLGSWVGMIVNAPTGTTSAALGGGITENSTLTANVSDNQTITNDISVGARTGNATVSENTSAGNASSGDAKAAVNLVNISGSQFALSDWFGILFINVFGTWKGSFGIDTVAGTLPTIPVQPHIGAQNVTAGSPAVSAVQAYRFTPTASGSYTLEDVPFSEEILAATTTTPTDNPTSEAWTARYDPEVLPKQLPKGQDWTFSLIGFLLAGSLLGTERYLTRRSRTLAQ